MVTAKMPKRLLNAGFSLLGAEPEMGGGIVWGIILP
jgi:hypothetical protein